MMFSEQDVSRILDAIPHGVMVTDSAFRIVLINETLEYLSGYSLERVKGVGADYVLHSSIARRGQLFQEVLTSGEPLAIEGDVISRDRRKMPVLFAISPLNDQRGNPVGLVVVLEDLSAVVSSAGLSARQDEAAAIIGQSPKMREILERVPLLAQTDSMLLITGETGTGKDKLAEAIHKRSGRSGKPFIKINCGALPEALLESELFGYVKGAFTGAVKDKQGMFRLAQGGTLFLTEVGDMPLPLQVKLLSVLDDQEFFPLGSEKKTRVDVRIMAATNLPLRRRVADGLFREDLFYRLNVLHLHLPPLREREADTRLLISHFLKLFAERAGVGMKVFNDETLQFLIDYDYPGNIRELRNIVEYCCNICQGQEMGIEHLPDYLLANLASGEVVDEAAATVSEPVPVLAANGQSWLTIERDLIIEAMRDSRGNRKKAAELLGWGRTTLWRKLKAHGLVDDEEGGKGGMRP